MKKHLGVEAAEKVLEEFPGGATKTLARILYQRHPALYLDVEAARLTLRRLRGAAGKAIYRNGLFMRPKENPGNPFGAIPKGLADGEMRKPLVIPSPARVLVLSDIHIPYHDKAALEISLKYGKEQKADVILLNGDTIDCHACSHWLTDPRERDFKHELESTREVLKLIRKGFPKARIIFKHGNHEERWEAYMFVKAPELLGVEDFLMSRLLRFEEFGIEEVKDKRVIRLGKLNVIHGHEYKSGFAAPVNPARGFYLRAQTHCLGGHYHQVSQHSEKTLEGHIISTWSTGCICNMSPSYAPYNKWSHGFAFVTTDRGGAFNVKNFRIIDGSIY